MRNMQSTHLLAWFSTTARRGEKVGGSSRGTEHYTTRPSANPEGKKDEGVAPNIMKSSSVMLRQSRSALYKFLSSKPIDQL